MRVSGVVGDGGVVLSFSPPSAAAGGGFRSPSVDFKLFPASISLDSKSPCFHKIGIQLENRRMRSFKVRALESSGENQTPVAPLQFESPTGQLLSQIMQTHPHLLPTAIDQQLERLQTDLDAQKEETPPTTQDLLLYSYNTTDVAEQSISRRIAEVKDKERQKALEEIIYCLIVQKFMDNDISMIPAIPPSSDPFTQVDSWPNQEQKLEAVHSHDALEMIESHLSLILGDRVVGPLNTTAQISKIKLGKLYAASIMYGYFLKRVDQRFQLERTMKTFPQGANDQHKFLENLKPNPFWDMESTVQISSDDDGSEGGYVSGSDGEPKSYKLRSYVMYLDAETLQRYATMRSKEAISLIEKQTQALFGRPDIRISEDGSIEIPNDEVVAITFSGLTMLVLEAVAFGSFLWDAEGYVESKYHFLTS